MEKQRIVKAVRLHPNDSVAVLVEEAGPGDLLRFIGEEHPSEVVVQEAIPYGHKVVLHDVARGRPIVKYGEVMGIATQPIGRGAHAHTHNVRGLEPHERGGEAHAAHV